MIVYMINYLSEKIENFLDWVADSLVDFALELDEELFDQDEIA